MHNSGPKSSGSKPSVVETPLLDLSKADPAVTSCIRARVLSSFHQCVRSNGVVLVIPEWERQRQEDQAFQAILDYLLSSRSAWAISEFT